MQLKGNEVHALWRVLRFILIGVVSALIIGTAIVFSLAIALTSGSRDKRSRSTAHPELIVASALALVFVLWRKRESDRRGSDWHACGQCGVPIEPPSRVEYCSPTCRRYARLRREEIERRSEHLASFGEVPF
jgi:hypothetical protein